MKKQILLLLVASTISNVDAAASRLSPAARSALYSGRQVFQSALPKNVSNIAKQNARFRTFGSSKYDTVLANREFANRQFAQSGPMMNSAWGQFRNWFNNLFANRSRVALVTGTAALGGGAAAYGWLKDLPTVHAEEDIWNKAQKELGGKYTNTLSAKLNELLSEPIESYSIDYLDRAEWEINDLIQLGVGRQEAIERNGLMNEYINREDNPEFDFKQRAAILDKSLAQLAKIKERKIELSKANLLENARKDPRAFINDALKDIDTINLLNGWVEKFVGDKNYEKIYDSLRAMKIKVPEAYKEIFLKLKQDENLQKEALAELEQLRNNVVGSWKESAVKNALLSVIDNVGYHIRFNEFKPFHYTKLYEIDKGEYEIKAIETPGDIRLYLKNPNLIFDVPIYDKTSEFVTDPEGKNLIVKNYWHKKNSETTLQLPERLLPNTKIEYRRISDNEIELILPKIHSTWTPGFLYGQTIQVKKPQGNY